MPLVDYFRSFDTTEEFEADFLQVMQANFEDAGVMPRGVKAQVDWNTLVDTEDCADLYDVGCLVCSLKFSLSDHPLYHS